MTERPLTIWTSVAYPPPDMDLLTTAVRQLGHQLLLARNVEYSNLAKPSPDTHLADADVAFGQPDPDQLLTLPRLKWVHITSAGYTNYDRNDLRAAFRSRSAQFTNSSSVYAEPCAQHALAMMLAHARQMPAAVRNQDGRRAWLYREVREGSFLLNGQSVLLVGFGAIARRLAELLAPLHMDLTAVRRTPTGREPIKCFPTSQLDELLPHADHIVDLLPLAPGTQGLFDARRFARMKPSAVFYNLGRGDTVDQEALRQALASGRIAAACLDVMTPEPLPPDHPLWTTPNCFITPHTAGGHATEFSRIIRHFLDNLQRFQAGQPLEDRVF